MPNFKPAVLTALAVMLTASAAWAASPAPKGDKKPHAKLAFEAIDTNKDGGVTLAELKSSLAQHPRKLDRVDAMFKRLDKNADSKIDKAEFDAWKAKRHERRQRKHDKQ